MKENEKSSSNSGIAKVTKEHNSLDPEHFARIDKLVDVLKDSTLASQFMESSFSYDKDGNIVEGSEVKTFNKADMVMCLGLGASLGIDPYIALSYGKNLNIQSVKKIVKGEKLGLDFATSLEQIYIWGSGSKEIIYTSIHIVNGLLTKANILREIIKDGKTPYTFCTIVETGKQVEFDAAIHKDVPTGMNKETYETVIAGVKGKGFIPVYKDTVPVYIAEMKLTRYNKVLQTNESISIPYSSKEAIDAGLLKGINSDGEAVKGKDNWNCHRAAHLMKMTTMIGSRIIGADILGGIYLSDEVTFIKDNNDNAKYEDAEIV